MGRVSRGAGRDSERRPGRWLQGIGALIALGGLAWGGYLAWQFWGTDVVAQRTHHRVVSELEQAWPTPTVSTTLAPPSGRPSAAPTHPTTPAAVTPTATVTPESPPSPPTASPGVVIGGWTATAIVRIPRFGDEYAVPVVEGDDAGALAVGIGHIPGTAGAGEVGNYVIAGHRVTHGSPLQRLPELVAGDVIVVDTAQWRYTYLLLTGGADLRVPFTQTWVLDPLPRNPVSGGVQPPQIPGQRLITIVTCAELFHTDDRLVAFGRLLSTEPRPT